MDLREDIRPVPHTAGGSERLSEETVRAYLEAGGYERLAEALTITARHFPGTYFYTPDRHRYVCRVMPGDYWLAGDSTASEERIKALGAARKGRF